MLSYVLFIVAYNFKKKMPIHKSILNRETEWNVCLAAAKLEMYIVYKNEVKICTTIKLPSFKHLISPEQRKCYYIIISKRIPIGARSSNIARTRLHIPCKNI